METGSDMSRDEDGDVISITFQIPSHKNQAEIVALYWELAAYPVAHQGPPSVTRCSNRCLLSGTRSNRMRKSLIFDVLNLLVNNRY